MRFLVWIIGTYLLLVVQTAICPLIAFEAIVPNLFAALLMPCLGNSSRRMAIVGAAAWGLAMDSLGTAPLGINMISFTLVAMLGQRAAERRGTEFAAGKVIWMAPAIVVLLAVEMLATWPLGKLADNWTGAAVLLLSTALYSFLLGLSWLVIAGSLRRFIGRSKYDDRRDRVSSRPVVGW